MHHKSEVVAGWLVIVWRPTHRPASELNHFARIFAAAVDAPDRFALNSGRTRVYQPGLPSLGRAVATAPKSLCHCRFGCKRGRRLFFFSWRSAVRKANRFVRLNVEVLEGRVVPAG